VHEAGEGGGAAAEIAAKYSDLTTQLAGVLWMNRLSDVGRRNLHVCWLYDREIHFLFQPIICSCRATIQECNVTQQF